MVELKRDNASLCGWLLNNKDWLLCEDFKASLK